MFIQVFKLEGEEKALASFGIGTHVIGRGPRLQCNDKRVSRNHATLAISDDSVKITSTHINPCFLRMASSKTITILSQDSNAALNDGDAFAFLPDAFWFKLKIVDTDLPNSDANEIESNQGLKRELNGSEEETNDKRIKLENQEEHTSAESQENDMEASNNVEHDITSNDGQVSSSNEEVKKEETNGDQNEPDDANVPTSTTVRPRRERCWYGAECYRKNPDHRRELTHPGDSDFESDPDDNRPSCSYGATCYRKNKDHRKAYKHPPRGPPSKQKKKRARKKVDCLNVGHDSDLSDLSEDPFEEDGDSDEYVEGSETDDTDWEDSQDVDEDSENVKRLVKEAKRFTKNN